MASKVSELSILELAGVTLTEGSGPLGKVRKPGVSAVMTSAELKVSVQDFSHSTVKFSKSNKTSESCQNTKRTSLKNLSPEVTSDLSEEKDWHCCAKSSHNSATMEQLHCTITKKSHGSMIRDWSFSSLLLHHSVEILGWWRTWIFIWLLWKPACCLTSHLEKAVAHKSWHTYNPLWFKTAPTVSERKCSYTLNRWDIIKL